MHGPSARAARTSAADRQVRPALNMGNLRSTLDDLLCERVAISVFQAEEALHLDELIGILQQDAVCSVPSGGTHASHCKSRRGRPPACQTNPELRLAMLQSRSAFTLIYGCLNTTP